MSDLYTVTVRAWKMRAKLAKPKDKPHVKKVCEILKTFGKNRRGIAYDKLSALRDSNTSGPRGNIYSKGADDALRMLSRFSGTPARNKAKVKHARR
jgi:hypothetical protein